MVMMLFMLMKQVMVMMMTIVTGDAEDGGDA